MTTDRETKNAIFAAKAAMEAARQTPQQKEDTLGFDLEIKTTPIPSLGLVYPEGHPLCGVTTVDIKPMTTKEQDILTNRMLAKNGKVVTELLKSCVLDKNIDVTKLVSGDRNAIMFMIRISGYTKDYIPKINCPKCGTNQKLFVDLEQLPLKTLDLQKVNQTMPNSNEFSFVLPVTKKNITFQFLTGEDEERILQEMEMKKKKGVLQENLVTTRLINSVLSVEGHYSKDIITRFCSNLPARDSLALTKHIDANEPGIEMETHFTCSNIDCDFSDKIDVPMTSEFFLPEEIG